MRKPKIDAVIERAKAKAKPAKKVYSFRLEVDLIERLEAICAKKDAKIGPVVEEMIRDYLGEE